MNTRKINNRERGKKNQLNAFKHYGYWQCMDTIRDKEILEKNLKIKELV